MKIPENKFRDYLYNNYKENLSELIIGKKEPLVWDKKEFPPIHVLLQQRAEKKINETLEGINELSLVAREMRLFKKNDSITRVDLFGNSHISGPTIIEIKKSRQTERQAFTELLAYSNHFCTIFPSLTENSITSLLIAPMETRIVRDSFVQELLINKKNLIALIPIEESEKFQLKVYYPNVSYYQWFENKLLDDQSMLTVAMSFSTLKGRIDSDIKSGNGKIPHYSKKALDTISNTISHKLESLGYHSLVYSAQMWSEVAQVFPYPNTIYVVAVNPFAAFRTSIQEDTICGNSDSERLQNVQYLHNQLNEKEREYWIEDMETHFHDNLIQIVKNEFNNCFLNKEKEKIPQEISVPDWYGIKTSLINAVTVHNLDIYLTGLIREIYSEYIKHGYNTDENCIFYGSDLPKYSYETFREFFPVWEILRGLGFGSGSN